MKVIVSVTFFFFALVAVAYTAYGQDIECPIPNPVNVTLIPDPKNCSAYYDCSSGLPISMPCPKGLHFNDLEKVCDWPSTACCDLRYDPKFKCPNHPHPPPQTL